VIQVSVSATASAQLYGTKPERQGWYVTPSIAAGGLYEDNVFFVPGSDASSPFARLTPGIEVQYRRRSRSFDAGYNFDAERYPEEFDALTKLFARQEAYGEYEAAVDRRSSIRLAGSFLSTTRPEEVLQDTGLLSTRRLSRSVVASARFARRLSRRLSGEVGYLLSVRDFERPGSEIPTTGGTVHALVTGVSMPISRRTLGTLGYTARLLIPEEVPVASAPSVNFSSHVVTFQIARRVSKQIDLNVTLGPRVSEGLQATPGDVGVLRDFGPEADASIALRAKNKRFELRYTKTQQQALGLGGFTNTERYTFRAVLDPTVRTRFEATPAYYKNERAGIDTTSIQVDMRAQYQFRRSALVEASYRFQYQDRFAFFTTGGIEIVDQSTRRNTFMVSFKLFKTYDMN